MNKAKAADEVTVIVEPLHTVDYVFCLRKSKYSSGEGETYHLNCGDAFASVGITLLGKCSTLHATDTACKIESGNERACRILLGRNVAYNLTGIDVRTKTAARSYHRNTQGIKLTNTVVDELRALRNNVKVHGFVKANDERLHFLNRHTAVGKEALEHSDIIFHRVECFLVTYKDSAATTEAELSRGEVDNVIEVTDHSGDLADGFILHGLFSCLDEIEVVLEERCVKNGCDAVFLRKIGNRLHILIGNRLTADKVCSCFNSYVGDIIRTLALDACTHLIKVNVALEGEIALHNKSLILDKLLNASAETSNVSLGCSEVIVHDDAVTGLNEVLSDNVLCRTSLVSREKVLNTEELGELIVHSVEGFTTCISIVCTEHCRLHIVTHCVNA